MKRIIILMMAIVLWPKPGVAVEQYPEFDQPYWEDQVQLAKGKIQRGAGLGVLGLVSIWPTTVLWMKTREKPDKYMALSAVFSGITLGALAHGVGSVGFGIRQRKNARSFVEDYKSNPEAVDRKAEADEYLQNRRRTTVKTAIFGSYLATISAVLLTNAVLQTVREKRGDAREDIRIWPYYLTGGLLLAAGVGIIISARKKLNDLDRLESTSVDTAVTPGIAPFWNTENGNTVFGVSMNHTF